MKNYFFLLRFTMLLFPLFGIFQSGLCYSVSTDSLPNTETQWQEEPHIKKSIDLKLENPEEEVSPWLQNWTAWTLGGIIEPLAVSEVAIDFFYVDESPSEDNLRADIELEPDEYTFGGNLGIIGGNAGWYFGIDVSFTRAGENNLIGGSFGLGKKLMLNKIGVVPSLQLGFGEGNFKLGDLRNNDQFIQINNTQFYSEEVAVKFKQYYGYAGPQLNFILPVSKKLAFQLSGSYKFAITTKERVVFRGYLDSAEEESAKEKEKLDADNVFLEIDGKRVTENTNLMDFSGFKGQLSFVFRVGE